MNECPSLEDFARLLANPRDDVEWRKLETHLATCGNCQHRLDTLIGDEPFPSGPPSQWRCQAVRSTALQSVIQQLQRTTAGVGPTVSPGETAAHPAFLQPTDEPGFLGKLGDYPVRRVIGQGGMGIVLEAVDPVLKRTVAIKMLSPWRVLDEETKGRFLREAQAAAALTHENLVAIHAVVQDRGGPFLVLEYIAGESLQERLVRQGKLPLVQVARLGAEVARGLAAAHAKGLVHRDIKPANILLVEATGRAKIADFGLAKTATHDAITIEGTLLGTPEFMSPEQAAGKEAGPESDLFSLGAVLYLAASGVSPFRDEQLLLTLENVRRCQPTPLKQIDASLPDWFCQFVHQMLASDPRRRPASAAEVAASLERQGLTPPDSTNQPPTEKTTALPNIDRRWLIASLAVATVALLMGVGIWLTSGNSEDPAAKKPVEQPHRPVETPVVQTGFTIAGRADVFENLSAAVATAEDRDVIEAHGNGAYLTPPLTIEGKRLTIRAAASAHPVFLTETPGTHARQPFVQSDSDLRLEGLEIHWAIDASPELSEANLLSRSVVVSTHGRLIVDHCRIACDRFNCCVGGACRDVLIRGSHLMDKSGMGVFWRAEPAGRLEIEGSVLENRFGVTVLLDGLSSGTPGHFHLSQSTISAERALQLMIERNFPKHPLPFVARRNLIDSGNLFVLMRKPMPRNKGVKPDSLPDLLTSIAAWTEDGNIYRRGTNFIGRASPLQPGATVSAEVQGVEKWLELWKLPAGKSIEGEIRFQQRAGLSASSPLVFDSVNKPSGEIPKDVGADDGKVGPGPAYHAWRASPEYANWPPAVNSK